MATEFIHYLTYFLPLAIRKNPALSIEYDKPFKFHTLGYLIQIKQDVNPYYKACPAAYCLRRLFESPKGL